MLALNIPIKDNNPFIYILKSIDFIPPYSKLTPREMGVLSELFKYNYEFKDIERIKRNKLIFDADVKNEIANKFDINIENLYNVIKSLKKKGFVNNGTLNYEYVIEDPEGIKIKFI